MKSYLKGFLVMVLLSLCINLANLKFNEFVTEGFQKASMASDTVKVNTYQVTATMYYPVASQCDSDPLLTAGMYRINPEKASEQKWIAMSRDLIERWGGEFAYGDYVQISGAGEKDGVYKVVDTMNKRFTKRIDFLETRGTKPYKFENVTLTKVEWKTQENALASL